MSHFFNPQHRHGAAADNIVTSEEAAAMANKLFDSIFSFGYKDGDVQSQPRQKHGLKQVSQA